MTKNGPTETGAERSANHRRSLIQFIKFALVGGMNTGVDFLVFSGLLWIGVPYLAAQGVSYSAGMLNSYVANKFWTFQASGKKNKGEFIRFALLNVGTLLMSLGLMYVFTDGLGLHPLFSKLVVTGATVVVNFLGNKLWVFKRSSAKGAKQGAGD